MLFTATFSVPAGTTLSAPVTTRLPVARGIIHLVEISFLDGPENEVNVILRQALHQIVPTNPDGTVVGNANTVSASLQYSVEQPPYEVQIDAWSPDADYSHQVAVKVHILPRETLFPPREELGILKRMGRLILGEK